MPHEGLPHDTAAAFVRQVNDPRRNQPVLLRQGEVTAVDTSDKTVSIKLGGSTDTISDVTYIDGYAPVVGDYVQILMAGPSVLVIGRAGAGTGPARAYAAGALVGSLSDARRGMIIQAGSSVITTNSAGDGTINFPYAFPTGVVTVTCGHGDRAATWEVYAYSYSVSSFTVRMYNASGGIPGSGSLFRINWFAMGF